MWDRIFKLNPIAAAVIYRVPTEFSEFGFHLGKTPLTKLSVSTQTYDDVILFRHSIEFFDV